MNREIKRVAIYPGSFNPIHNGHIAIAKEVLQSCDIDEVWMIVSPQSPHKLNQTMLSDNFRLKLTSIATKGVDNILVSDFEFNMPKPSYTIKTLDALSRSYPDSNFTLIIGGDNLACFDTWLNGDKILSEYGAIVYPRPDIDIPKLPKQLKERVTILKGELLDISSTLVREKLDKRESLDKLVPQCVEEELLEYIDIIDRK